MTSPLKRRWFAFRLRTLLVVVVVLGCVLTPLAFKVKKAREQKRSVEWVLANGGEVRYDWQGDSNRERREARNGCAIWWAMSFFRKFDR